MKLTTTQKRAILPLLQQAVQSKIDCWDAQRQIEGVVGKQSDNMEQRIEDFAICVDFGSQITLSGVQEYVDHLEWED
ncbi:MAG TPA: hypothetical protein VMH89_10505 [Candidatus Acidoferrum sp.]|nr:hypothetical protein [Candidatus Acidoferrum sp.]